MFKRHKIRGGGLESGGSLNSKSQDKNKGPLKIYMISGRGRSGVRGGGERGVIERGWYGGYKYPTCLGKKAYSG